MKNTNLKIIDLALVDLKPYESNPRLNQEAVPYVKKSIEQFGFLVPIVVDKDNVIICGHTRYLAANELGMGSVPCVRAEELTQKEAQAFRLIDNKVSEIAQWNFDVLDKEIFNLGDDFDMQEFGFELPQETNPMEELSDELGDGDVLERDDLDKSKITIEIPRDKLALVRGYRSKNGDEAIVDFIIKTAEENQ